MNTPDNPNPSPAPTSPEHDGMPASANPPATPQPRPDAPTPTAAPGPMATSGQANGETKPTPISAASSGAPAAQPPTPGKLEKIEIKSGIAEIRVLSEADQITYFACEEVIANGWATFVQVGLALATIRDRELYTYEFTTFEEYCRKKWAYGRYYAYRLIAAAQVFTHLLTNCQQKPERESQVRPLIGQVPDLAKAVWERAVAKAAGGKVTAGMVQAALRELQPLEPPQKKAGPTQPKQSLAEKRKIVNTAIGELLVLLNQKASHSILTQKVELLHSHIQKLFPTPQKKGASA